MVASVSAPGMHLPRIPICNSPSRGVQTFRPSPSERMGEEHPIHWDRLRRGRGQPLEPRRDGHHPPGYGPHRSPGEIAGPAGSPVRLPAGHCICVPFPRALVPGRVSRMPSYPVGANGDEQWGALADEPWAALAKSSSFEVTPPGLASNHQGREPHDAAVLRVMSS